MRPTRWRKVLARVVAPLILILGPVAWVGSMNNFDTVDAGRVYRSGQMPATRLGQVVRDHGIKTVLNLRGPNPKKDWYRAERATTLGAGAVQVDLSLATDQWLSQAQAQTIVEVL